jgi:eukaryotic-like serine/threonine-protein kinase
MTDKSPWREDRVWGPRRLAGRLAARFGVGKAESFRVLWLLVMHSDVAPGQIIADKYRVERVLGEGGMGYVIAAHHLKLDQRVALKFLKQEALAHEHVVHRFAREARAAAKIRSEHVARVIDVGDLPSGVPYIVMEYLEGEDLGQRLHQRGALPVEEAIGYVLEACEALAEAHAAGIVHRDLKPPNLFLARAAGRIATIKVLDFGISKALDEAPEAGRHLTSTSMIMGTPLYMSPEQLRSSRDVDPRADIWALGVVLFELLTGRLPFDGENTTAVITAIVADPPRSLLELRADAPRELWPVLLRCLSKSREERFPNVLELARSLAPFSGTRAQDSLARIESIVRPVYSDAPPADTEVSHESALSTLRAPVPSAAGFITAVDVTVPSSGATGAKPSSESLGLQPTVRSAELSAGVAVETRANWDATLPAAEAKVPVPRRSYGWLVAAAVLVSAGGYGVTRTQRATVAGPEPVDSALPSPSLKERRGGPPAVEAAAPALPAEGVSPPRAVDSVQEPGHLEVASAAERVTKAPATVTGSATASAARGPKPSKKPEASPRAVNDTPPPPPAPVPPSGGSLRMGIK